MIRKSASLFVLWLFTASTSFAQDMVITGVIDGPLSGGVPKAVELCVLNDIPDLSIYGLGSANNGGGSDGQEFDFPATAVRAGTFIHVAMETPGFAAFFGFDPTYTGGFAAINGDDAIELFTSGTVTDIFGDINVDGTGQPWEHLDGWAYRSDGTGPDGDTFEIGSWSFSGPNALDGETTNASAATPFPIGSFAGCELPEAKPEILLSEILVTPTGGEFIEIYNPGSTAVDLSDVYLTDATFAGGGAFYYNIVTGADAGGGGFGDFHARFPDGAMIEAGELQTVALAGSIAYLAEYGSLPNYELWEDDATADGVSDMREALPGSINNQGGLSNSGEVVILYAWDGASDLVEDIDYAPWGDNAEGVDKTGVSIDGPDADAIPSVYAADLGTGLQDVIGTGSHAFGNSFQRTDFNEGAEIQIGGNGILGSNETSEDLSVTWTEDVPTPGELPEIEVEVPAWVINEVLADPDATVQLGDANGDGIRNATEDEFVELVNASGAAIDISGWTLSDAVASRHTFPADTVIEDGCAIVVFGGGEPTGDFGGVTVQTASGNALGLNNGGDSVTLANPDGTVVTVSYGGEGGQNQSLSRDPDVTGVALVQHSTISNADGAVFSPGTRTDGTRFQGCTGAPAGPTLLINELLADPDASVQLGDANGDGARSATEDEFVEFVNVSGADLDVSGWTVSDGVAPRHVFPADSVVLNGCSAVVFGGGSPTGDFGGSLVMTASAGALGLNNGGDSVTVRDAFDNEIAVFGYGGEGGQNQSLTRDPDVTGETFVQHTTATDANGAVFSPGTKVDGSKHLGCPGVSSIADIQGSGESSPLEGQQVSTSGIVTAVANNGFFMQMPDDGNPDTSNGIFVFTGGAPNVAVGDTVDVSGEVDEFFGLTQLTNSPTVTVTGTGDLPPPIVFDENTPSPDPANPSCALEFECYEGMRVEIPAGIVAASNQEFGSDPFAEVHVTAGPDRPFREPGVETPGLGIASIPVWDGNPEVFELDPDKLGLPNLNIPARSTFSAVGVIGYEFNHYEFWPTELNVEFAPLPVGVRAEVENEATIGSFNLFRLFDDVDDGNGETVLSSADYARRTAKIAAYVVDLMRSPDVLAIQEIESLSVMEDLAAAINALDGSVNYSAYLVEGNDVGGIDVGFLTRENVSVEAVTQLGADELLSVDGSLLHDRPPLLLEATIDERFEIVAMVLHMRSLGGIETTRTQQKRYEQAQSVASKVQAIQDADPEVNLVVLGDFNAFEFTDGYVDLAGIVQGDFNPDESVVCTVNACEDRVSPNLVAEVLNLPPEERYSFIFRDSFNAEGSRGDAQILDHIMTSQTMHTAVTGIEVARGNVDAAEELVEDDGTLDDLRLRSSDHDGMVLYFDLGEEALKCDVDYNGYVDRMDIRLISRLRGTMSPPSDPNADYDENGVINILDARGCTRVCTLPRCSTPR